MCSVSQHVCMANACDCTARAQYTTRCPQIYGDIWKQLQAMQAAQDTAAGTSAPPLALDILQGLQQSMPMSIDASPFAATPSTEVPCSFPFFPDLAPHFQNQCCNVPVCHTCHLLYPSSLAQTPLWVYETVIACCRLALQNTHPHNTSSLDQLFLQSSATVAMPSLLEESTATTEQHNASSLLSTSLFVHPLAAADSQPLGSHASPHAAIPPTALEQLSGRCVCGGWCIMTTSDQAMLASLLL